MISSPTRLPPAGRRRRRRCAARRRRRRRRHDGLPGLRPPDQVPADRDGRARLRRRARAGARARARGPPLRRRGRGDGAARAGGVPGGGLGAAGLLRGAAPERPLGGRVDRGGAREDRAAHRGEIGGRRGRAGAALLCAAEVPAVSPSKKRELISAPPSAATRKLARGLNRHARHGRHS